MPRRTATPAPAPELNPIFDEVNDTFLYGGPLIDTPIFDQLQAEQPDLETAYRPSPEQLARDIVARKLAQSGPDVVVDTTYTAYTKGMAEQINALIAAEQFLALPSVPYVLVDDAPEHDEELPDIESELQDEYDEATTVLGTIDTMDVEQGHTFWITSGVRDPWEPYAEQEQCYAWQTDAATGDQLRCLYPVHDDGPHEALTRDGIVFVWAVDEGREGTDA